MLNDNAQKLLAVLQSHAPDGAAQQACSTMAWKAEEDGATPIQVEATLASALSDGFNHGNWPWSVRGYRVADSDDVKNLLPSDIDKSAYNPDDVDLVFMVDNATGQIRYGRAVDCTLSADQMFNVVLFDDGAELVPVGPWKPIEKEENA